jgi:hypothetical protein
MEISEMLFWMVGLLVLGIIVVIVRKLFGPTEYEKEFERQKNKPKKLIVSKKTWQEVLRESTFLRGIMALCAAYLIVCLFYPGLSPILRTGFFFPLGLIALIFLIITGLWMFLGSRAKPNQS